jgi:hypothetical protein
MSLFYHKTCKTIQNLFNNMVIAVNGSQPLAVATWKGAGWRLSLQKIVLWVL